MEHRLLVVTIASRPSVKLIANSTTRIEVDDQIFEEVGAGDTNGFYDFLRQPNGNIVGVRFAPFVELSQICDLAIPGPGLRINGVSPTASLELFWGDATEYDHASSADQFFDENYIFKSSSGMFAVTFGFAHLSENEIGILLSAVSEK